MKLVVHCKRDRFDVYIGRPTKWGNPFQIGVDGDRAIVIAKFRSALHDWIRAHPEVADEIRSELRGKILGCWCAPLPCHGDVLAEIANAN